jgi:zinc transporter ZupT
VNAGGWKAIAAALLPVMLVAAMVVWFANGGSRLLTLKPAPIEKLAFERIEFKPQEIVLHVRNEGPETFHVAQVFVNDALWDFSIAPNRSLGRFGGATISIPFDWLEGEPYTLTVLSGNGIRHAATADIAMPTPAPTAGLLTTFALLGVYVGVVPVCLGLLWLPALRAAPRAWVEFWLALTMGLLVFLGIDTIKEALEVAGSAPSFTNGVLLTALGAAAAFLGITAAGRALTRGEATASGMGLALLIAIGIGLHNLGEGLAIGAAYTLGEVALGSFLIIGFTIHNTTEGLAILSPLVEGRASIRQLALLGLIGGGPTILGTWVGAFTYSTPLSLLFLGVGAGAIFQVVRILARAQANGGSALDALGRGRSAAGFIAGFLLMYATSLLVAG